MTKREITDKLESLELQLAELSLTIYTLRKEIEENLKDE